MLRNNNDNGNRKSDEKEDDGTENTTATRFRRLRRLQTPKKLFSFLLSSSSHSSSSKKKNSKLNPTMDEALRRRLSLVAEYANEMMDDVFNNNNNNNAKKKLFFEYKLGTTEEQRQERIERQVGSSYEEEEEEETSGNSSTNNTSKGNDERFENNNLLSVTLGVDSTIDEPTTIEDILFPQEELRREVDALEKDPDDFDFEGEEDFVASLSKNELFRNVSAETRGFLLFNLIIFFMGSNIVLVKMAQTNISPDAFGLFRFLAASLTFLPFSKYALRDSRILKMGIELGFWCAVGYSSGWFGYHGRVVGVVHFVVYGYIRAVDCHVGGEESAEEHVGGHRGGYFWFSVNRRRGAYTRFRSARYQRSVINCL